MKKSFVLFGLLTVLNIVWGMPTWENDDSSSVIGINRRHCSCSEHHHKCGCCQNIRAHPMHARVNAAVCMNASYVSSPLGADFLLTWNEKVMFNETISAVHPPPRCFDVPHVSLEACVKFKSVSMKKGHTGGCVSLEFKAVDFHKDIPLGCFFFRAEGDSSLDIATFLDSESLVALFGDFYEAQPEGDLYFGDTGPLVYLPHEKELIALDDDVTDLVSVDKAGCKCSKSPPRCDCCVQFKLFHFPLKACVHGDVDLAHAEFNLVVTINGITVFKEHISERNPPPICRRFKVFHISVKLCLRLTDVSLLPGHIGGCVEMDVDDKTFSLGCLYMQELAAY